MNKVEALKACLDGKTVVRLGVLLRFSTGGGLFEFTRTDWSKWYPAALDTFGSDGYELYVEPPREVTRAEAWAALDLGKVVRVAINPCPLFFALTRSGLMVRLQRPSAPWERCRNDWIAASESLKPKFYILDCEP